MKEELDKFNYQKLYGHTLVDVIPDPVRFRKNKEKAWEYGYNEEYDFICVSQTGEVGDIYELQNLRIGLPAVPEDVTTIRFHDKPTKHQKWIPYDIPEVLSSIEKETSDWNSRKENRDNFKTPTEIFLLKPKSFVDKYMPYIDDDFDRRKYGLWQMVNGRPIWIPPSHYFMLQHDPVQGNRLPDFRFTNRDYYLFWEAVKADYRALGMIYLKNRRSGASTMAGSEAQNIGTQISEGFIGIMSKTNRDSVSFLNKMVIRPFKKLPWYFKPQTSGTTSATSGLNFRDVAGRISAKNTTMTAEMGLDTSIKQFSTSLNSMDGEKVDFMVLDEFGKYPPDVPADQYWSIAEECLTEGFKVVGKAMVVSTVNAQSKGGKEFKEIYYASDVRKRTEEGRTVTGLYSLFIPAEWNQEGGYDEFGYSIVEDPNVRIKNRDGQIIKKGNLTRLVEKGASLKKQSAVLYNEFLRKHPRTESHAFRDPQETSDFNLNKINEQMDHNEMIRPAPYQRGNFINNSDDPQKPLVEWIPSFNGRFYIKWMPKKELQNNFQFRGGYLVPMNDFGCFGVDPYKVSKTVDSRGGSKGSMHGVTDRSLNLELYPNMNFFLEYIERPLTLDMFIEDMINAMLFYGIPALIENNVPNLLEELRRRNMTKFAIRRKDKLKPSYDEKFLGGIPTTSEKVRQLHYFVLQAYIEKYVGVDDEGVERDKGQMGNMVFNRTLKSWSQFSPDNRTSEDASISSGLALMGLQMINRRASNTDLITQAEVVNSWAKQYKY